MSNRYRWHLLVLLICVILGCGNAGKSSETMQNNKNAIALYYIPFELHTYTPVTPESIEQDAACVFSVHKDSELAETITGMVEQAPVGTFGRKFVRLKVVGLYTTPIFMDKAGGIHLENAPERKLDTEEVDRLNSMLRVVARSNGCPF